MVGLKVLKRAALAGIAAAALGLTACPSPFLARIQEEIAKYPFAAAGYTWVRQWGNAYKPEWTFVGPIVKADPVGNVYVADSTFQIRKFNTSGVLQKTYALQTTLGLGGAVYDMAFDASGNLYVMTNNANQIQKYTNAGVFVTDWGGATTYGGLALSSPRAVAVDAAGSVYVGDQGNQRVVKFDSSGVYQTSWGGSGTTYGSPALALGTSLEGISADRSNNVYVADENNSRVVRFSSAGAYSWSWGGSTTYGGTAFVYPRGITLSPGSTQYVYLADTSNHRIVRTDTSGTAGTAVIIGSAGTTDGLFNYPNTVAVDTSSSIYVTDESANGSFDRVQKFNSTPTWVATWGGNPGSADGVAANVGGIAFDSADNSYVVDVFNRRIQKYDSAGAYAGLKWGSSGSGNGQFSWSGPPTIAMTAAGNIYVPDTGNNRIQYFDAAGTYLGQWGSAGSGDGQFISPTGVAIDPSGTIYVADLSNRRIQVFDSNGLFLRKWGSVGTGDGQFQAAYGIAVDKDGNVYVADMLLHRIQKFDSQGNLLLKWGTQGSADGQFQSPVGISVNKFGYVFVADMGNRRVQKFDSNGSFVGKWGSVGSGSGSFAWVVGIGVNSKGHVFTTDWYGNLVQEFQPAQ
jgi:tripartite motif-containing protein 71